MPLRNLVPLTFRPKGLSDAVDATNAFPGAMQLLANLVPMPGQMGAYVPRPAANPLTAFAGFNTPGFVSVYMVTGSRIYGMIASQRFPGFDEPFCFDALGGKFVPISGVNANNVPKSPFTIGDWIPPTIAAPTAERVLVTHPGFRGAGPLTPFFGWFDVSGFVLNSLKGNTTAGSNVIASINDGFTSAPILDGIQPGQLLTNAVALGFAAGTTVTECANGTTSVNTTGTADGTAVLTDVSNTGDIQVGFGVAGPLIAPATTVIAVDVPNNKVTLSQNTTAAGVDTVINFSGGGTITVSSNCSTTASQVTLDISGGTLSAPLWGAGNTNTFPLLKPPIAVAGFNGRAWFAVNNAIVLSDSFNPTQVTNTSQALIVGDNTDVTAFGGLPFINTVTGGAQQALIVFKGPQPMYQITGDPATNNLELNIIEGSVGTLAPNTITSSPTGLFYIAIDGLRMLDQSGRVSEPMGTFGEGVSVPFLQALYPSRMCAAFNQNTLRVSLQRGDIAGNPWQEVAYDFRLKSWHGPHSFPASLISEIAASGDLTGFIVAPQALPGQLFFSSIVPQPLSQYVENGQPMTWTWETSLLPDNNRLAMNRMLDTNIGFILPMNEQVTVTFLDESSAIEDQVFVTGRAPPNNPLWGQVNWGQFIWGAIASYFQQYRVAWTVPLIFKQGFVRVQGTSAQGQAIGNLYMGYQPLGYGLYILEDLVTVGGYTGITATQNPDSSFTAIAGLQLPDGSFTAILASLTEG